MLRSVLVDSRIAFIVSKRPPLDFGHNPLGVRRFIPILAQLVAPIAEGSRGAILKEVIEARPEEGSRLFVGDVLIGH